MYIVRTGYHGQLFGFDDDVSPVVSILHTLRAVCTRSPPWLVHYVLAHVCMRCGGALNGYHLDKCAH